MVAGFACFVVSSLLIYGIRSVTNHKGNIGYKTFFILFQNKSTFILPWIVETIIQTTGAFLILIVKVANPGYISVMKVTNWKEAIF